MNFTDHMILVGLSGAATILLFLIMGGLFKLIELLTKGKFCVWIIKMMSK